MGKGWEYGVWDENGERLKYKFCIRASGRSDKSVSPFCTFVKSIPSSVILVCTACPPSILTVVIPGNPPADRTNVPGMRSNAFDLEKPSISSSVTLSKFRLVIGFSPTIVIGSKTMTSCESTIFLCFCSWGRWNEDENPILEIFNESVGKVPSGN